MQCKHLLISEMKACLLKDQIRISDRKAIQLHDNETWILGAEEL